MDHRLETRRLKLRRWQVSDLDDFANLHSDEFAMRDLGGPISWNASERKLIDYMEAWEENDIGRWYTTDKEGQFLGYVGISKETDDHPIGQHYEIGWRLQPAAWGKGYAVEAAEAAITDAFRRVNLPEILAYTAIENARSKSVISKLPFDRASSLDFSVPWEPLGTWHGLAWRTDPDLASELL